MADEDPPRALRPTGFAGALRRARATRRMSQLDLALECEMSARHLSFLETGRAQPSRDMVLRLAEGLTLPLGSRNTLLLAAGFAPAFPVSALDSAALEPFRTVLAEMMTRHAPYPAMLCDRHWTARDANPVARAMLSLLAGDTGETNVVRMLTDNPRAAEVIVNLPEVIEDMAARIRLEALEAPDDPLLASLQVALERARAASPASHAPLERRPLIPIVVSTPGGHLSFFSTIAHFGTSEDVTVRDLRLELLFPADETTRTAMYTLAATLSP